jgi:diguanylate cyclase (GGDEF)-like protein
VLLVDLDNFKSINDRFGHAFGDRVLQMFAATARGAVRGSDFVGRLGGEEFAVVLHGLAGASARLRSRSGSGMHSPNRRR